MCNIPTISLSLPTKWLAEIEDAVEETKKANPGATRISRNDILRHYISLGMEYSAIRARGSVQVIPND